MKWYLDFGHGGKDPGALGQNKTKESDTVLKIGLLIKNNLEKAGEIVITTRENDTYHSLDSRSTKANKEKCDYFISLHMNSSTNKTAKGCEVWVYDKSSKLYNLATQISTNLSNKISKTIITHKFKNATTKSLYLQFYLELCKSNQWLSKMPLAWKSGA